MLTQSRIATVSRQLYLALLQFFPFVVFTNSAMKCVPVHKLLRQKHVAMHTHGYTQSDIFAGEHLSAIARAWIPREGRVGLPQVRAPQSLAAAVEYGTRASPPAPGHSDLGSETIMGSSQNRDQGDYSVDVTHAELPPRLITACMPRSSVESGDLLHKRQSVYPTPLPFLTGVTSVASLPRTALLPLSTSPILSPPCGWAET